MKKTFLALFVSSLGLLICGCGSGQTDQPADESTAAPSASPTVEPSAEAAIEPVTEPTDVATSQLPAEPSGGEVAGASPTAEAEPSVAGAVGSSLFNAIMGSSKEDGTVDEAPAFD